MHQQSLFTAATLLLALLLPNYCSAQLPSRCLENPVVSPCTQPLEYYYNQTKARCQANPNYGECSGTQNRFLSLTECQGVCEYDLCELTVDSGNEDCAEAANTTKYYYDSATNQCKTFTYQGCDGNDNRFDTASACATACPNICQLPQDQGTCTAQISRYFFDSSSGQCKQFYYFGCAGNKNNFETVTECEQKCLGRDASGSTTTTQKPNIDDDCLQERDAGPCYGHKERYYYDQDEGRCRRFIYGGCRGNRNNFYSLYQCERRCTPRSDPMVPDFCKQEPEEGDCSRFRTRYHYNATSERCERFSYSGCGGNSNNFRSYYSCRRACRERRLPDRAVCSLERERGPCNRYIPRYYYDQDRGQCRRFIYGGCEGNGNNFGSLSSCQYRCEYLNRDVCSLERERGPCRGRYRSYYYDEERGRCRSFLYGGCEGNGNRFRTLKDCQKRCDTRYIGGYPPYGDYDRSSGDVDYPDYGDYDDDNDPGCRTRDCDQDRPRDDPNTCILVKDEGPCRARLERYYFDRSSGTCRRFFYGGCQGNANNFRSKAACERRCCPDLVPSTTLAPNPTQPADVCSQPRVRGPCRAALIRYFYDSQAGRCRTFIYGGCEGNDNNFLTLSACRRQCDRRPNPTTQPTPTTQPNPTTQESSEESSSEEGCSGEDKKRKKRSRRCYQPEYCGPCDGILMRYYYEPLVDDCIVFIYGGCYGNGNNFRSYSDCKKKCLI